MASICLGLNVLTDSWGISDCQTNSQCVFYDSEAISVIAFQFKTQDCLIFIKIWIHKSWNFIL